MNDNISDKDKKDWHKFINSTEKLPNKDLKHQKNKNLKVRSIDLHGYTLDEANVEKFCELLKEAVNITKKRLLAKLHTSWQAELEQLRRQKFRGVQQRAQWVVAGAVFASPVPSTDLLAVAVVNGLMINECE